MEKVQSGLEEVFHRRVDLEGWEEDEAVHTRFRPGSCLRMQLIRLVTVGQEEASAGLKLAV